jgi:hypothetical protein
MAHGAEERVMTRSRLEKRDLHALNADGMVLCNPRDREAAHRAQMRGSATEDPAAVTCRKCLDLLRGLAQGQPAKSKRKGKG